MALTFLIVDDQVEFRRVIGVVLTVAGFRVAGEAADGEQALAAVARLHPDVVLLDVQLPGIDGFEVARRLAGAADAPQVVLTSTRDASDYGARLTNVPVSGFIAKHELSARALSALVGSPS